MGGQEQLARQGGRLWWWPGGVSGAFLTSGSALQDWAWGPGVVSTGMLKPLASSRVASSVSCGQGENI